MSGPSGTPAPTGCVYRAAPVFGKPPIWTQQSRCTITDRRTAARCVGAAAGMGVQAIRCGTFLYRGWNRTREIQKPLVFGGVLFHISFAVERNMAAGGIEKKVVGPLRPLRGASIWVRRKMRTGCGTKKARSAVDRTRCAIGVGGGESRRCHSAGTK